MNFKGSKLYFNVNVKVLFVLLFGFAISACADDFYTNFSLTLSPSANRTAVGPLFYYDDAPEVDTWAIPPLISHSESDETDFDEWDSLYPIITLDRFGNEYRFQIFQLFSFSGGGTQHETNFHRFTLFPFYFQQRSKVPEYNYTALVPIAGHIKNRFFRDDIRFVLFPIWGRTRKRDVVTDNYLYPFFHLRKGDLLSGWQFWPLIGHETRETAQRTNRLDLVETMPGHDKWFVLWPFWFHQRSGIGTENPSHDHAFLPIYSIKRSALKDVTTAPWPLGYSYIEDREKKYREWGFPWPFFDIARGSKTTTRFWPLFSRAHDATKQSTFYLWPVYKYNRITSAPLDRERTRIMLFLYSGTTQKNTETGQTAKRNDFWPLYTYRRDLDGNRRFQTLSLIEPILPASKSIERNYSHLWSLWRSESNPRTGAVYQSLLWDLYRGQSTPETKKLSFLFGLFKYESSPEAKHCRVFFIPVK
ncbi:MAG TPA: hypothetical protein VJ063_20380 [Verrucomicrobiae bacterium]|nr:hypothetical protein [Verrucomicrobiae bacterium]